MLSIAIHLWIMQSITEALRSWRLKESPNLTPVIANLRVLSTLHVLLKGLKGLVPKSRCCPGKKESNSQWGPIQESSQFRSSDCIILHPCLSLVTGANDTAVADHILNLQRGSRGSDGFQNRTSTWKCPFQWGVSIIHFSRLDPS